MIRIVSHPKYPNCIGSPGLAIEIMARLCKLPGHNFWPDDISLIDGWHIDSERLLGSAQATDTYLLRWRAPTTDTSPPSTTGWLPTPCVTDVPRCM